MALWWGVIWSTSLAATCRWVRLVFIPTKNLAKAGTEVQRCRSASLYSWGLNQGAIFLSLNATLNSLSDLGQSLQHSVLQPPNKNVHPTCLTLPQGIWTCYCTLPHVYSLLPTCPRWHNPDHSSPLWPFLSLDSYILHLKNFLSPNPIINCDCLKKIF